jgi:hypothetical protein
MSYGPYRYQNGNKYTFGSDGRWWIVTSSHGGSDYGYPVGGQTHHGHHSRHHASSRPALPAHSHQHHHANGPARRVATTGSENPDDLRIRQLAIAINHQAGWIGTWQGIAGFYGASLAGAVVVVAIPAAGTAINEALLGPAEGRIFYMGYRGVQEAMLQFIEENGGRIITQTRLGAFISENIGFGEGFLQSLSWRVASMLWATGAGGIIHIFISPEENPNSFYWTVESMRLLANRYAFFPFYCH